MDAMIDACVKVKKQELRQRASGDSVDAPQGSHCKITPSDQSPSSKVHNRWTLKNNYPRFRHVVCTKHPNVSA